jgi:HEAT repeat protein
VQDIHAAEGEEMDSIASAGAVAAACLHDESSDVRLAALEILARSPQELADNVPAVAQALGDSSWYVRRAAVVALSRLNGLNPQQALDYFVPLLADDADGVRVAALQRMGNIDPTALAARAVAIMGCAKDNSVSVREAAFALLAKLPATGPHVQDGLALVAAGLADLAAPVRVAAVRTLAAWGTEAIMQHGSTLKDLVESDAENEVRHAADQTLCQVQHS